MQTIKYIKLILKESYKWRNRQLIEPSTFIDPKLTTWIIIKSNLLAFLISGILSFFMATYINEKVAGFLISSLSIFVSLFTSVLILMFDKYLTHSNNYKQILNPNADEILGQRKIKNFSRQFLFISLESLIISLFLIVLLGVPLIFEKEFPVDICEYSFVTWDKIEKANLLKFLFNVVFFFSRLFAILLLYKFFKYLFYIFGALGAFFLGVFRNNIKL